MDLSRCLDCILTTVNKHHDLMALLKHIFDLFESGVVQILSAGFCPCFAFDTYEMLLEWDWAKTLVEIE